MRIFIEYHSSWRNSFLDGSNNEKIPNNGRKFIASNKQLKLIKPVEVTKDTIMGILNRLIGDQRKLYQSRIDKNYYFADIEELISTNDIIEKSVISNEIVFIRNISGNDEPNSYVGLVNSNDETFTSSFSKELWGILWLNQQELIDFIIGDLKQIPLIEEVNPLTICRQFDNIKGNIIIDSQVEKALSILENKFNESYLKNDKLDIINLYCSALYLQVDNLKMKYDLSKILSKQNNLSGISKKNFTKKDFMGKFSNGKKIVFGNPYLCKTKIKGKGEIIDMLTKADGKLEININISKERALDLKEKIDNAGVGPFYLGKKGLAYLYDIKL
jgi:hypothetical protein